MKVGSAEELSRDPKGLAQSTVGSIFFHLTRAWPNNVHRPAKNL
jgi:hypothetical protein